MTEGEKDDAAGGGTYALLLVLDEALEVEVGSLGMLGFPAGTYVYAGSALRGLQRRLARHARAVKRTRWHIDRLTTRPECRALGAVVFGPGAVSECRMVGLLSTIEHTRVTPPGFGSSDHDCAGHLVHLGDRPEVVERAVRELLSAGGSWLSFDGVRRPGTFPYETEVGTGEDH